MAQTLLLSVLQLVLLAVSDATWTWPTSTLIRSDYRFAVGAYNDTIFLLGGNSNNRQITEYHITTNVFVDIGANVLTNDVYGYSQFWSQTETILYMLDATGSAVNAYNMKTRNYTQNWQNIDYHVGLHGCLANTNDQLFVVGGLLPVTLNTLKVMTFATSEWLYDAPLMNEPRGDHGCIAYYNYLWVFGGYNGTSLQSNERIDTTNIVSNQWHNIESLTVALRGSRATAFHSNIFIIGGKSSAMVYHDIVHIVDVTSGGVTVSTEKLLYPMSYSGVVSIHNIMYAFGGMTDDGTTDKWMQYNLATKDPTEMPSKQQTNAPSSHPTAPVTAVESTTNTEQKTSGQTVTSATALPTHAPSSESTTSVTVESEPNTERKTSEAPNNRDDHNDGGLFNATITETKANTDPYDSTTAIALHNTTEIATIAFNDRNNTVEKATSTFTISITVNDCKDDEVECSFDEDKINDIIIAHFDDNAHILSTDVVDNRVNVIIWIEAQYDSVLEKDVIVNGIQNELEHEYDDVDVIIEETDSAPDINTTSPPSSTSSLTTASAVVIILSTVFVACICCILLKVIYQRIRKRRLSEKNVNNTVDDVDDASAERNDDDEHKDDVEEKKKRTQCKDSKVDVVANDEDSISHESLYDDCNDTTVITPQTNKQCKDSKFDVAANDEDSISHESLYDDCNDATVITPQTNKGTLTVSNDVKDITKNYDDEGMHNESDEPETNEGVGDEPEKTTTKCITDDGAADP